MAKTARDSSRQEWGASDKTEVINIGSLQRIADATEKMASSYDQLRRDRDNYRDWYRRECEKNVKLSNSNAGLRGYITRLKTTLRVGSITR